MGPAGQFGAAEEAGGECAKASRSLWILCARGGGARTNGAICGMFRASARGGRQGADRGGNLRPELDRIFLRRTITSALRGNRRRGTSTSRRRPQTEK